MPTLLEAPALNRKKSPRFGAMRRLFVSGAAVLALSLGAALSPASAMSLVDAVGIAVDSNPQIGEAMANREATEFELQQAFGLYAPRVDLQASTGIERLDNPSRRAAGIQDDPLFANQVGLVATYSILDGGFRQAEANRQAARVDGASARVLERSEYIGLEVTRQYFQVLLQMKVVGLAAENVSFHQTTLSNVQDSISSGNLTAADRDQAVERLNSAKAKLSEAQDALVQAEIAFNKLVGTALRNPTQPGRVGGALPTNLAAALSIARSANPQIKMAQADVDAAAQVVQKSIAGKAPTLSLEGRAQAGYDINGVDGYTTDLQANLVFKMNIFDGGIQDAQVQENERRLTEAMMAQQQSFRDVEEAVRVSWQLLTYQQSVALQYKQQLDASDNLVSSYREQFTVGQRSLLDVLDAQNTRFNVQVLYQTASYSARFAEYRILASTGGLLAYLGVKPPEQATVYARELLNTPAADTYEPRPLKKLNLGNGPIDLTQLVN